MVETSIDQLKKDAHRHLREQYAGIFTEDQILAHYEEYAGLTQAEQTFASMLAALDGEPPKTLLDLGSGFGSFVHICRREGVSAIGLELARYDSEFAVQRHQIERSADDKGHAYLRGDGQLLPFREHSFDVVTLWNVLEHIPQYRLALRETYRVLKPGGTLLILAPNYAAFRREAHYHVPWLPLFPKPLARRYLQLLGRDPIFLNTSIHYCTHSGVLSACRRTGYAVVTPGADKLANSEACRSPKTKLIATWVKRLSLQTVALLVNRAIYENPLRSTIAITARKGM